MTTYIKIDKPKDRTEWLKARQRGIGGSDVPALILSPEVYKWSRPLDVYKSKTGEPNTETSLACRVGTALEGFVAELFTEASGLPTRNVNKIFVHKDYPFMLGNIDRKIVGANMGLEKFGQVSETEICR